VPEKPYSYPRKKGEYRQARQKEAEERNRKKEQMEGGLA
jgi:hypothetical protein